MGDGLSAYRTQNLHHQYLSGKFSVEFMMKLSGHKKYDTFKKYVRLSAEEYADDIAKSAEHCLF